MPAIDDLDLIVVGSGVAGLTAAVTAAEAGLRVAVVTKGSLPTSTTRWAQGGVAAVLGGDEDSPDAHLADTLEAGDGLCDVEAVRILVNEGPARVRDLIALGAAFDRASDGSLDLVKEGGHSHHRIVHAGGAATGVEVERALVEATQQRAASVFEYAFAVDLLVDDRCQGVRVRMNDGEFVNVLARHTLIATGGAGQLFAVTTNPREATGDGIAIALRAGVPVADVEFMQFHPTALHHPSMPRPLLSEALRGHGAHLLDSHLKRFVDELLPRDRVSREMARIMREQGVDHLWLDVRHLSDIAIRFPTIAAGIHAVGLDPAVDLLPVAPAAHHISGGILTDLDGAAGIAGLWAAGEVACSGVHGANRLASNSLLEGLVFGQRVVAAIVDGKDAAELSGVLDPQGGLSKIGHRKLPVPPFERRGVISDAEKVLTQLQHAMTDGAGVLRSAESLAVTSDTLRSLPNEAHPADARGGEVADLVVLAEALIRAATARQETRGNHAREDFPTPSDKFRVRFVQV